MTRQPPKTELPVASEYRDRLVQAAARCFERYGVAKASMEVIAREAGLSRRTTYRTFTDRADLLRSTMLHLNFLAIEAMRLHIVDCPTLKEAIVNATLFGLQWTRSHPIYFEILNVASDRSVEALILESNEPDVRAANRDMWLPHLLSARERGELTSPLDDSVIIEGMRSVGSMLVLRTDLTLVEQRAFIHNFVLPLVYGYDHRFADDAVAVKSAKRPGSRARVK